MHLKVPSSEGPEQYPVGVIFSSRIVDLYKNRNFRPTLHLTSMSIFRILFFLVITGPAPAVAQTLFSEDLEGPTSLTLNTTDANSTVNITNTWLVNSVYAGGSGTVDCLGFPLDFTIPATALQPAGITNANGSYLHVTSLVALANGISCCSFGAADGFCTTADDAFVRMSSDVSTLGLTDVSLKFWWLCNGGQQNYGEVWYSTNGGLAWIQLTAPITQYRNQPTWVEQTASIPAFGNQATLRFGFRFHNGESFAGGSDPGFALDDIRIIASQSSSITSALAATSFCQGSAFQLPFTISGAFTSGNVFTVQLSDAAGSFASPVAIGSIASVTGGTIACVIPANTPAGNGYRLRVVASMPVVTGADNGANITIVDAPYAGTDAAISVCSDGQPVPLSTGGDAGGDWSGPSTVNNGQYDATTMIPGVYTYTLPAAAPCPGDAAQVIVSEPAGADAGISQVAVICKNTGLYDLFNFLGGSPDTDGTWTAPNGSSFAGVFNSDTGAPGIYTYTVAGVPPCASDEAVVTVQLGQPADAGADTTWTVCDADLPVNMTDLLTDASTDGVWYFNGSPTSANTSTPGAYTYIDFATSPCVNDTAFIGLEIAASVDAGENATTIICTTSPMTELIGLLTGSPDPLGTWTDPQGAAFSGLYDPTLHDPGLYTYTVSAQAPCPNDVALLAVIEDPCTGVAESGRDALGLRWDGVDASGASVFTTTAAHAFAWQASDAEGRIWAAGRSSNAQGQLRIPSGAVPPGVHLLRITSEGRVGVVRFVR
jgi:hypothetical protein